MDWVAWMDSETDRWQALIDSGEAWQDAEGARFARSLIVDGLAVLGPESVTGYNGERIPARGEIVPGSPGSVEYRDEMRRKVAAGQV